MGELQQLQARLGHTFSRPALLRQALTHRSYGQPNNERLEFLGDSVLNYTITGLLFAEHHEMNEGDLSRVRASLIRQSTLAQIANELSLAQYLLLGEGELKSGGFRRPSILSDALEAVFGAIYLDGGPQAAARVIEGCYRALLDAPDLGRSAKDAKTTLQELLQGAGAELPQYILENTRGADHKQLFDVICSFPALAMQARASGESRRSAEQTAAGELLAALHAKGLDKPNALKRKIREEAHQK